MLLSKTVNREDKLCLNQMTAAADLLGISTPPIPDTSKPLYSLSPFSFLIVASVFFQTMKRLNGFHQSWQTLLLQDFRHGKASEKTAQEAK